MSQKGSFLTTSQRIELYRKVKCVQNIPNLVSYYIFFSFWLPVEIEGDTDTEISFFTATYSQIHKSINAVGDINVKDLQGGVFVQARQVPELINTHENLIARAAQMLETVPNVLRLQSLAWPQIFSRRSIIIVANTEHVPKLVYLPAICTLVHVCQK